MILGIGVDTVDIDRFTRHLERTPALRARLFTEAERELPVPSLAARFAAKEALIKALGGSHGLGWHDLEVLRGEGRAPSFADTPALREAGGARRDPATSEPYPAVRTHLSMTHDGGVATAFVILEQTERGASQ